MPRRAGILVQAPTLLCLGILLLGVSACCEDNDGDGYTPDMYGYSCPYLEGDCDDSNPDVNPGATEMCNGIDDDCDGIPDNLDQDGDGYTAVACGGDDCDDARGDVNPGEAETCDNDRDDDCDGDLDCVDADCASDPQCVDRRIVFLTQNGYDGDLGGLAGADATCQAEAAAAGLSGTYKAWLSDSSDSPATRFSTAGGPFILVNGIVVASAWGDLIQGAIRYPIMYTAAGDRLEDYIEVWTNTNPFGERNSDNPGHSCQDWYDNTDDNVGYFGLSSLSSSVWTLFGTELCDYAQQHLYCFQQ